MRTEGMQVADWFWKKCVVRKKGEKYMLKQQKNMCVILETERALRIKADVYTSSGENTGREVNVWVPKKCIVTREENARLNEQNKKRAEEKAAENKPKASFAERVPLSDDVPF